MPLHLVLRLKAPIASFGIVAGEEVRGSGAFPIRSMVVGLIGNALGLDRCAGPDMQRLNQLQAGTWFAALMLSLGAPWEDVQNARVPTLQPDNPYNRAMHGGRLTDDPVLSGPKSDRRDKLVKFLGKPVQRRKHYVTDLHALVALSSIGRWSELPEVFARAASYPARPLWIGRKACAPSAPVCPLSPMVDAKSAPEALARSLGELVEQETLAHGAGSTLPLIWEGSPAPESRQAEELGIDGGFATRVLDRRDWVLGIHHEESVLLRGTLDLRRATTYAA